MTLLALALSRAVETRALELGFDAVGFGPATIPPHAADFERWLDAGYAGTMDYLARTRDERVDPALLLPGARSVVAVAMNYNPGPFQAPAAPTEPCDNSREWGGLEGAAAAPSNTTDTWKPVARYARGRDYHDVMRPRLRALVDFIDRAAAQGTRSRGAVDTSAVLERDLAARAGLGWIGKNTNLLRPQIGSYFFIGIVLTTATLEPTVEQPDRCGTCTACLDACPTRAFVAPYVLDARRCLSYLTIEHRDDIPADLAPHMRDWVFGCDICQEVCPWNRRAPATRQPALIPTGRLGSIASLLELDEGSFRARFRPSAIARAKRRGLVRNAALMLGNLRDPESEPALRRLTADSDPVIRRAAAWALERLTHDQPHAG